MKRSPISPRIFNSKTRRILFATCLSAFCLTALSVQAATITVMNTNDSGAGSLRQALADANDGDTIDFSVTTPATITLTSGELLVNDSVTITGPGADQLSVNGNAASSVFHIASGKTVTISGLTITNGVSGPNGGGGIWNDQGTLTVSNSTLSGNSAPSGVGISSGGGILNDHGTLTVSNSTLSSNSAFAVGGGIFNYANGSSATLTVNNSTLSSNSAGSGGGIFNDTDSGTGTLTINNSTLSGNSASDFGGGGIFNNGDSGSGTLTINNSTLSGNSASGGGGGLYNNGVAGNATLTIKNTTLSGNSAGSGGGILNYGLNGTATLTIGDTILNTGASGANISNTDGTVTSLGYNLSNDDASALLNQAGDQNSTDPMLGPLQDNGGPTFTHELLTGSPAIDMGDPSFTPPPDFDQRGPGFPRVVNNRIDIGAFEVQPSPFTCPQPQGFWKNNPDAWPVTDLTLGTQTYSKTELLTLLTMSAGKGKKADASLILARQLIAAKLNVANGSDPAPVSETIADADGLLSGFSGKLPYHVRPSTATGQQMVSDANVLASYNNGDLTPTCTP